jgi:chromosome segregation ATPase
MNQATLTVIGTVLVALVTSLVAPVVLARIKGQTDLEIAEREQWRQELRDRDAERTREIQSLKLQNRTLQEAHASLEQRVAELTRSVEDCQSSIATQNGKLAARDQEIFYLKTRVSELEAENRRLYREIDELRQGMPA